MELSALPKTWILDIDGTIVKHNGYLLDGEDTLLEGVKEFFSGLNSEDKVILLTARGKEYLKNLQIFLEENKIRYDFLLTDIPVGERILINDKKPSGLKTAFAVNKIRDKQLKLKYRINKEL